MANITIQADKARLSKLIERAEAGEEVVIARHDKPVVRFVPVEQKKPRRQLARRNAGQAWVPSSTSRFRRKS
jgi:prevent-host-death family protein